MTRDPIEKLKKILKVARRIRQEQVRKILKLDEDAFNERVIDWADEFGFRIDGDFLVIEDAAGVSDFISSLEHEFTTWGTGEAGGGTKVETYRGVQLVAREAGTLRALTQALHQALPPVKKVWGNTFGFVHGGTHVTQLGLVDGDLLSIPPVVATLVELAVLNVSSNQIRELPPALGELKQLTHLNVEENRLTRIPEFVRHSKRLQVVNLAGNAIGDVGKSFTSSKLTSLNLSRNKIDILPGGWTLPRTLKHLFLDENDLKDLPEAVLAPLKHLQTLNLRGNLLDAVPGTLKDLRNLTHLNLEGNPMRGGLAELRDVGSLKVLRLGARLRDDPVVADLRARDVKIQ